MGFLHPELLLFAAPALAAWWYARARGVVRALRLVVLALVVLALAEPYLDTEAPGQDVVVLVDRSRSMTSDALRSAGELVRLAEEGRGPGDRVGVVSVGASAVVERLPSESGSFTGFAREVDADGTDLAAGLEAALELIPEGRPGRVLIVSDGEENGGDVVSAARRAFARGVPVDVRATTRPDVADLSVDELQLPARVAVGEPFQFVVWVRSDRRVEASFQVTRGEVEVSSGRRVFEPGMNRLVFRDVLTESGVAPYRVRLSGDVDRTPENDVGLGAVRAVGPAAILVLNDDGAEDSLVRALRGAGLPVAVSAPEAAALDRLSLTRWRAVVLENVGASRLGPGLDALEGFVRERGGGLLVTGGKASFGIGGYHRSAIDELLPVSMELRQEHRKLSVALAIVMDRSGSMAAPVGGGTKMDLANLGAAAAIELLSPMDSVGVIAVDSAPKTVQDLVPVTDADELSRRVRRTTAGGGGIFVYSALLAAAKMLDEAPQQNRHVTLFSDAADSEEKTGVPKLLENMRAMGITVSVIALGTERDVDAAFLKDVARRGEGDIYFTTSAADLPRLFAQDTLKMARSTFVEEPTGVALLPGLLGIGQVEADGFPTIAGYNLNYLRAGAVAGAATTDDYAAPLVAHSYQGLGRTAVYAGQIGGTFGADLVAWSGFSSFVTTLARWLVGQEAPADVFADVVRDGRTAVVSVELADGAPPPGPGGLTARIEAADGSVREVPLERTGPGQWSGRHELDGAGVALGSVRLGRGPTPAEDRIVPLPPVALPYSPEYETGPDPRRGERLLRRVARESGGRVGVSATSLFDSTASGRRWRTIGRELLGLALLLVVVEIAVRRLDLLTRLILPSRAALGKGLRAAVARLRREAEEPVGSDADRRTLRRDAGGPPRESDPVAPQDPAPHPRSGAASAPKPGLSSTLARAKRSADRQTRR